MRINEAYRQSKKDGATRYQSNKTCPRGHIGERFVASQMCCQCVREALTGKRENETPSEKLERLAKRRDYKRYQALKKRLVEAPLRAAEQAKIKQVQSELGLDLPTSRAKAYASANPEKVTAMWKAYQKNRPEVYRMNGAKRRARKNKATPPWVIGEINSRIKAIYAEASKLTCSQGLKLHVDHIVPLRNKVVCGLHVPWNLRLSTKLENSRKNSKFDETIAREASIPLGFGPPLGSYQLL